MTKVTVIIPTYNRFRMLLRSLRSVAMQTMSDLQLYVVDDGSPDETGRLAENWPEELRGVSKEFIRYPHRGRPYDMVSPNLGRAASDYVAVLQDDDYWEPTFLERCTSFNPRAYSLAYTDYFGVRDGERWTMKLSCECATENVRSFQTVNISAAVFSRHFLDQLLAEDGHYFVPRYRYAGDWNLTVRLAKRAPFLHICEPLSNYQFHETQNTNRIGIRKIFEDAAIRGMAGNPLGMHDLARLWRWWISVKTGFTMSRLHMTP